MANPAAADKLIITVMRGLVSARKDRQLAGLALAGIAVPDAAVKASSEAVEFIRNACKKCKSEDDLSE